MRALWIEINTMTNALFLELSRLVRALWIEIYSVSQHGPDGNVEARESLVD